MPTAPRKTSWRQVLQTGIGGFFGWIIWAASPAVTGEVEPWDSTTAYYSGALFAAGFLSAAFWKRGFYWGPVGIFVGQVAYVWIAYRPATAIILPLPLAVAFFGTIQPIVGALAGWAVGNFIRGVWDGLSVFCKRSHGTP